ncbi:MAG: Gfo/Idh/MocA family oxidoreductase [Planctomycetes bacterium]|nr:Gfo/Idh/MocA family oxidoreductase [Planctomycetota bacterium]
MAEEKGNKLRMGIIGVRMGGGYGSMLHASEQVDFVAMHARTQESLDTRLKLYQDEIGASPNCYTDLNEMLEKENLDGVIISTPSSTHHNLAETCANHGVSVLIDKPVDINAENIECIKAARDANKVKMGVIYPSRLNPRFAGIKKLIDDQLLGKAVCANLRLKFYRDQAYYDNGGWRGTWEFDGGGSLMNQGAHQIDLLCWWFGQPASVIGDFAALAHDIESEDWASGIITFASGVKVTVTTTTCAPPKQDKIDLDLHAENGSIYVAKDAVHFSSLEQELESLDQPVFEHPVHDFIDALANNRQPMVTIEDAQQSVDLINALYESGRQGKRIEIPSTATAAVN